MEFDVKKIVNESSNCEFKVEVNKNKTKNWLKTIVGFANSCDGYLVFGIDDDLNVVGLKDVRNDIDFVTNEIKTKIQPEVFFKVSTHKHQNKDLLIIEVKKVTQNIYKLNENSSWVSYVRKGNQTNKVSPTEEISLIYQSANIRWDEFRSDVNLKDETFYLFAKEYEKATSKKFMASYFQSFLIATNDGKLTNAGKLFADNHLVYYSRIFCNRWNGINKVHQKIEAIDSKEYSGNVIELLKNAESFIDKHLNMMWKKENTKRVNYPDYPYIAFHEALVNAIAHRDYFISGSEITVDIYDDRMEITSPGSLFIGGNIQDQNLYDYPSRRRNQIIADLLEKLNMMERRGSGLSKIINQFPNDRLPIFYSDDKMFRVTLKNLNYNTVRDIRFLKNDTNNDNKTTVVQKENNTKLDYLKPPTRNYKLTEQQQKILDYGSLKEEFKSSDIQELLKIKDSRARKILAIMLKQEKIEAFGSTINRKYKIKK